MAFFTSLHRGRGRPAASAAGILRLGTQCQCQVIVLEQFHQTTHQKTVFQRIHFWFIVLINLFHCFQEPAWQRLRDQLQGKPWPRFFVDTQRTVRRANCAARASHDTVMFVTFMFDPHFIATCCQSMQFFQKEVSIETAQALTALTY